MFKSKKKDLPARPQPPTWEQMEEDLRATKKTDVIFALGSFNLETTNVPETEKNNEEELSQEKLFQQAMEFVVKNDELQENMQLLQEKTLKLRDVTDNLKKTVESVRQQALVAIDGYENKG